MINSAKSNKHLLSKVFGWFYFSINAGSFISTLLCPFLLADPRFGPRWAFGIPGVAMFIATIFFWAGRKKFVHIPPAGLGFLKQMFSREGLGALLRLAVVYVFVAMFWSLWDQSSGGSWTLQAQRMDLYVPWLPWISFNPFAFGFGVNLIPAQVQTANPILILIFIPLVNYVIYPMLDRFFRLTPLRKIGIGLFLTAGSYVVIWHIQTMIDSGLKPSEPARRRLRLGVRARGRADLHRQRHHVLPLAGGQRSSTDLSISLKPRRRPARASRRTPSAAVPSPPPAS